jgi:translation elongation factor EF-1beta
MNITLPEDYRPWDVDIDTTKAALERCMRALLMTGSLLTCHMRLSRDLPLGRGITAILRVQILDGREGEFDDICKPQIRVEPGRIQLGMSVGD